MQVSGKISPFCFHPVESVYWKCRCPVLLDQSLFSMISVPSPVFKSKLSSPNCNVPTGWEHCPTLLCCVGISGVDRSLKRQTSLCPGCLTQLLSLKHPSAFHLIHVTVVDPRSLVPNLALLVMSISITSKALVFFCASRINGLAFILLFRVSLYIPYALCCRTVSRGLAFEKELPK